MGGDEGPLPAFGHAALWRAIDTLAAEHGHITVVGDGDQSVYGWRGADVRNISQFENAFEQVTTIILDQNYRSTQTILDAANAVIANNPGRAEKHLWSDKGHGARIVRYTAEDEGDEATWVARTVKGLHDQTHVLWRDIATFYRTNAQSRVLEEALMRFTIPYKVVGGTRFYDRKEVKDAMAYLRAVVNHADEVSVKRVINVPKRGVGDTSIGKLGGLATRTSQGTSDYILYSFQLISARTSEIVWEDSHEIKKQGLEDAAYR